MAEHTAVEFEAATGTDYADHLRTYQAFLRLTKYAVIGSAAILILMAIFLL